MEKIKLFFVIYLFSIIGCKESIIENVGLNNVKEQIKFQDSALVKNTDTSFLTSLNKVINHYREIEDEKLISNPNYNFYLARLYSNISNINPNIFYDSLNDSFKNKSLYVSMYDSAINYSKRLIKLDPNNINGYFFLTYTIYFDNIRSYNSIFGKNIVYPAYAFRKPDSYKKDLSFLYGSIKKIKNIDTSENNKMSQIITEALLRIRYGDILENHNNLSFNILKNLDENDLNQIVKFSNMYESIDKPSKYIFINNGFKELFIKLNSFGKVSQNILNERYIEDEKKYQEKHILDNVTADVYENGNCNKIWIYSNGRYLQQLYEQNTEALSYHERMNIYTYDLITCSIKDLPLILKHESNGKWEKIGSTFYFYPDSQNKFIVAGTDDKNRKYMFLNPYDNLEYFREDGERVVMNLISKNCSSCVN